jgi:cytochrome c556
MFRAIPVFCMLALLIPPQTVGASDTPQEERHELMEDVGDAAKPVGKMLKGERAFDAAIVMESFRTWSTAAGIVGDLFPEGSETGYDTKAKDTIWSDREGFNARLAAFGKAVDAAIEANPQDLAALEAAAGPVFKECKACHKDYRVEDED